MADTTPQFLEMEPGRYLVKKALHTYASGERVSRGSLVLVTLVDVTSIIVGTRTARRKKRNQFNVRGTFEDNGDAAHFVFDTWFDWMEFFTATPLETL